MYSLKTTANLALSLICLLPCMCGCAQGQKISTAFNQQEIFLRRAALSASSRFRGWDYLVEKLRLDGVTEQDLELVFTNTSMPLFEPVPFSIAPRESAALYQGFTEKAKMARGRAFLKLHRAAFDHSERTFKVSRFIIAAILLIETSYGENTGKELIINRLARIASVGSPDNLDFNYRRLKSLDPAVEFEQVVGRARYLEKTFHPEILALFEIRKRRKIDLLHVKGSVAGAFGIPQFLPTSYIRHALDGNRDNTVSLFQPVDAIVSTANFLACNGWKNGASLTEKRKAIWNYNKSDAYIDAVLTVSERLKVKK